MQLGRLRGWRDGTIGPYAGDSLHPTYAETEIGRLFEQHEGRLAHKWGHYFPAYSREFDPYRSAFPSADGHRPLRFLELGVSHGGSLEIWREFFGPTAVIFGIDVNPRCAELTGLDVRIGSQTDAAFLVDVVNEMGGIDIVLDDGSHHAKHQRASFDVLFSLLSDGGIYAVEDLHTAYWTRYGGGLRRRGTFIETLKQIVDDMHAPYHLRRLRVTGGVTCVTFYDSLAFVHKGQTPPPSHLKVGKPSF
jgi:hypothetical protein